MNPTQTSKPTTPRAEPAKGPASYSQDKPKDPMKAPPAAKDADTRDDAETQQTNR